MFRLFYPPIIERRRGNGWAARANFFFQGSDQVLLKQAGKEGKANRSGALTGEQFSWWFVALPGSPPLVLVVRLVWSHDMTQFEWIIRICKAAYKYFLSTQSSGMDSSKRSMHLEEKRGPEVQVRMKSLLFTCSWFFLGRLVTWLDLYTCYPGN